MSENKRSAFIKQNPRGPHYYVDASDKSTGLVDSVTDMMNHWLQDRDIGHEDIEGHTKLFRVSWDGSEIEIDFPQKSYQEIQNEDWYREDFKTYCRNCYNVNYRPDSCVECGKTLEPDGRMW